MERYMKWTEKDVEQFMKQFNGLDENRLLEFL